MTLPAIRATDAARTAELDDLQRALRAQRQGIATRLGPTSAVPGGSFPRSRARRFLIRRPAVAMQLVKAAAVVLVGDRIAKVAGAALLVAGVLRSVSRRDPPA